MKSLFYFETVSDAVKICSFLFGQLPNIPSSVISIRGASNQVIPQSSQRQNGETKRALETRNSASSPCWY